MNFDEALIRMVDARIAAAQVKNRDFGVVVQRDTTGPGALVVFDGASGATPVKVLAHVDCFEGDRVALELVRTTWVVVGTFARHSVAQYSTRTYGPVGSGTTSSTTAVDMPSSTALPAVVKRYDDTGISISLTATLWATATTAAETSVYIQGTPGTETASTFTPLVYIMCNAPLVGGTASRTTFHGNARGVIPAGSYTLTARWRRSSGSVATLSMNESDMVTLQADEYVLTV